MPGFAQLVSWIGRKIVRNQVGFLINPGKYDKSKIARLALGQQKRLAFVILHLAVCLVLFVFSVSLPTAWAQAQSPAPPNSDSTVTIYPPVIDSFPNVRVYFDLYDGKGNFIEGLDEGKITILENARTIDVQNVKVVQPGIHFTVAMNAGSAMSMMAGKQTFLEKVMLPLRSWAEEQSGKAVGETKDDFSFSTQAGMESAHLTQPREWLDILKKYKPDLEKLQPNLVSLTQAIDQATDSTSQPRVRRVILYITPALPRAAATNLANLVTRARQVGVRVHVWMVSPSPTPEPDSAASLRVLAEQTGGQFILITAASSAPEVEPLLAGQRNQYEVVYQSAIRDSGTHKVAVQVDLKGRKVASKETNLVLNLQPPNPIFLSPPNQIKRGSNGSGAANELSNAESVPLSILIEFPDGFQRPLKATRLFVDGVLVAENTRIAFDQFAWTPVNQANTRRHMLRVEAEDVLGLSRSSIEIPVEVISDSPERLTVFGTLSRYGLIAVAAMIFGSGAVVWVLLSGIKPRKGRLAAGKIKKAADRLLSTPAIIQKVDDVSHRSIARLAEPVSWLRKQTPGKNVRAQARLVRISNDGEIISGSQLPVNLREIVFGSDPRQVDYFIDAPCVDKIHATLYHRKKGEYVLVDNGSIAGTWVNYELVSSQGVQLVHGDLIHFGRMAFQFEENNPARKRQLLVVEEGK